MDDVMAAYTDAFNIALEKNPGIQFPQSQLDFFRNLKPIDGAIDAVNRLRKIYDVYVLTAPSYKNPLCYMEKRIWIEEKFDMDMVQRLIISPNKSLLKGDYLIDDNIQGKGQEDFEGILVHFGSNRFPTWYHVEKYLQNEAG